MLGGGRRRALCLAALLAFGLIACDGGDDQGERDDQTERTGGEDSGAAESAADPQPSAVAGPDRALFAEGRDVFRRCAACHNATARQNKVGPHLVGLFGRAAGAVEGFRYSDAMRRADIVWDEETLRAYLRDPRGYIPGNRMAFPGIRRDDDLDALIAYLRAVTTPD